MRKLFFVSLISLLLLGCSKENPDNTTQKETPEIQCKKIIQKTADLFIENPAIKKMSYETVTKIKSTITSQENINKCVINYEQKGIDCINDSKTTDDLNICLSKYSKQYQIIMSPEVQCKKAMDKIVILLLEDPIMKNMPQETINKMKEQMTDEKNIKKCVDEFKQETIDCVMKTETLNDMQKCK